MDWAAAKARWDAAWHSLQDQAVAAWGADISARPTAYASVTASALDDLKAVQEALVRWAFALGKLGYPADLTAPWEAARVRYQTLAAGIMAESTSTTEGTRVGAAPVVLIVGGLALTVAAVAWAVAAKPYTESLRIHAETQARELEARVSLNEQGRKLQDATVPPGGGGGGGPQPMDLASMMGLGLVLLGSIAAVSFATSMGRR